MYAGRIVESADTFALFDHPVHPYTRGLLASVTSLRRGGEVLETIPGVVPNLLHLPEGCSFSLRCPVCGGMCADNLPPFAEVSPGHFVLCHLAADEAGKAAESGAGKTAECSAGKAAEGDRREAEV